MPGSDFWKMEEEAFRIKMENTLNFSKMSVLINPGPLIFWFLFQHYTTKWLTFD